MVGQAARSTSVEADVLDTAPALASHDWPADTLLAPPLLLVARTRCGRGRGGGGDSVESEERPTSRDLDDVSSGDDQLAGLDLSRSSVDGDMSECARLANVIIKSPAQRCAVLC